MFITVTRLSRIIFRIVKRSCIHKLQLGFVNFFIAPIGFICFSTFTEKDISDFPSDISGRTQDNVKIHFGMRRTKSMKALLNWVKYFYRISGYPAIVDMNKVMFIQQLDTALYRSDIRKKLIDQSNTKSNEASPGPLESENKWKESRSKFINYLSTLIGVNVFPLP